MSPNNSNGRTPQKADWRHRERLIRMTRFARTARTVIPVILRRMPSARLPSGKRSGNMRTVFLPTRHLRQWIACRTRARGVKEFIGISIFSGVERVRCYRAHDCGGLPRFAAAFDGRKSSLLHGEVMDRFLAVRARRARDDVTRTPDASVQFYCTNPATPRRNIIAEPHSVLVLALGVLSHPRL